MTAAAIVIAAGLASVPAPHVVQAAEVSEQVGLHGLRQVALVARAKGWDKAEVEAWYLALAWGTLDHRDIPVAEQTGWSAAEVETRKWAGLDDDDRRSVGLAVIPAIVVGTTAVGSWTDTSAVTVGTPVDSNHSTIVQPALPPYRILNPGDTQLYLGALAFHKNGIAKVECAVSGGTVAEQTELSYDSTNGGTWGYWFKINEADISGSQNGGKEVRFHAYPAANGISRVYGNAAAGDSEVYRIRINADGAVPRTVRWSCTTGVDTNDGKDPTGCACTAATWTALSRTLTETGKFANVNTSLESKRYIWIDATGGFTAGLYYVQTKNSNDSVVIANSADPAGIALTSLPGSNGTNITSATGPTFTCGQAAIRIGAASGAVGSDNGTVYICAGDHPYGRTSSSVATTFGVCTFRPAPGLTKADVAFTSNTVSGGTGNLISRRIRLYDLTMKAQANGSTSGGFEGFVWFDSCDILGLTPIERSWDGITAYPPTAPTGYGARVDTGDFTLGIWVTGGNYHYMGSCIPSAHMLNVSIRYISEGPVAPRLCVNCTILDQNKSPYGESGDHTDCIQFSQSVTLENRLLLNFQAFNAASQIMFCRSTQLKDVAFINVLGVHTTNNGHLTQFIPTSSGTGDSTYRHIIYAHVTLPNTRINVYRTQAATGGSGAMTWTDSVIRYTIQGYITNTTPRVDSGLSISDGHSYDAAQQDTINFSGFTSGNPTFLDGAYNANYSASDVDYTPATGSLLLDRVTPGTAFYPVDINGDERPDDGQGSLGAVQKEVTASTITPIPRPSGLSASPIFHLWLHPGITSDAMALAEHPNVRVMARANFLLIDSYKPPGAPDYTTTSAVNIAKRLADWIEYLGGERGRGAFHSGTYDFGVYVQNWFNSVSLMRHPDDAAGATADADYAIFHLNGRKAVSNTSPYSGFITPAAVAAALKSELDSRDLVYPKWMLADYEESADPGKALDWNGSSQIGWWFAVDPLEGGDLRYGTEAVYKKAGTTKTLGDFESEFSLPAPDYGAVWYGETNKDFSRLFYALNTLAYDYALDEALYQKFQAQFAQMICGNYQIYRPTVDDLAFDVANTWLNHYIPSDHPLLGEYGSPEFYGPNMGSAYPLRWGPHATNPFGTTYQDIWRGWNLARVQAVAASGDRIIPWLDRALSPDPWAGVYTPTVDDQVVLLRAMYDAGITEYIIWCDNWSDPSPAEAIQATREVINRHLAYIDSLDVDENRRFPTRAMR